jgi:aerobic-type carbon monoxide dehydrogenase small subunit (CoxS/CutS family)
MRAVGLIREGKAGSDAEIREEMSGNICRCGAYPETRPTKIPRGVDRNIAMWL